MEDDRLNPAAFMNVWFTNREMNRAYRKRNMISSESPRCGFIFDEAAVAASNYATKTWIEATVAAGTSFVFKGDLRPYFTPAYCDRFERVLEDLSTIIPGLADGDIKSSVYAYILACRNDIPGYEYPMETFVTGNRKFLRLIEEEGSREELHDIVCRSEPFPGVFDYMFIDNEGQLKPANLKWDDPTRPSDKRTLERLAQLYMNSSSRI